jgi:hypothetical protein
LQAMMDRLALENEEVDGDAPEDEWIRCRPYNNYVSRLKLFLCIVDCSSRVPANSTVLQLDLPTVCRLYLKVVDI